MVSYLEKASIFVFVKYMVILWEPEGGPHLKFQKPTRKTKKTTMYLCWPSGNQLNLLYCLSFKVREQWGSSPINYKKINGFP